MFDGIITLERAIGVDEVINWGLGKPGISADAGGRQSAAGRGPNLAQRIVGLLVASVVFAIIVIATNFLVGFVAVIILVHFAGLLFLPFLAIFPAVYTYLTFWNRFFLGAGIWMQIMALKRQGYDVSHRMMWGFALGALLVLPAAYFLSRYGVVVAGNVLGINDAEYHDLASIRGYMAGFLEPGVVFAVVSGIASRMLWRRSRTPQPSQA